MNRVRAAVSWPVLVSFTLLQILGPTTDARATQIKNVQRANVSFAANDPIKDTTITSVDVNNTAVFASSASSSLAIPVDNNNFPTNGGEGAGRYIAFMGDLSTVSAVRYRYDAYPQSTQVTGNVEFEAAEFNDGFQILHGQTTFLPSGTSSLSKAITVPTYDTTLSIPILQTKTEDWRTDTTEAHTFRAQLTNGTTLTLDRNDVTAAFSGDAAPAVYVDWQILSFLTDATVKKGTVQMGGLASSVTATVSPAITNLNKVFLVMTYKAGIGTTTGGGTGAGIITMGADGKEGLVCVRGTITDAATLTFNRAAAGASAVNDAVDIAWYVVEFTDPSSLVQKGTGTLAAATASTTATLTAIDPSRSFVVLTTSGGDTTSGWNLGDCLVRGEITNATTLTLSRIDSSTNPSPYNRPLVAANTDWFVVELPPYTVKSPNGSEVWKVGQTQNITWKHAKSTESGGTGAGGVHKNNLLLSKDGGATFPLTIATGVLANADTYAWTIPDLISATSVIGATLKVRILDTDMTVRNTDDSNSNFEIKGNLTLTAPAGGESWNIGTPYNITWTKNGSLDYSTVTLKLSLDSGSTFPTTIASLLTPSALSYSWTPANGNDGTTNRVRIELVSDPTNVYSASVANFAVRGKITLTAPNGGQTWPAQTAQNITWTRTGVFPTVKIEYSTNSGGSFPTVVATGVSASAGTYSWTVPVSAISSFGRIKITSEADSVVTASSAADFSVVPSILVTSPNTGAEVWRVGESRNITWNINGSIATVKIEYSTNGGTTWVAPAIATGVTASGGTYAWTIPDAIGDLVLVKISDEAAPATRFDASDNNFKIRGKITMVTPNGGEIWAVGSSQIISWTKNGSFGNVDILYSTDGGVTFPTSLATNQTGTNWTWNPVPDVIGTTVKVRVRATNALYSGDTFGDSAANFAIKGSYTITSPNGGELWAAGSTQSITWTKTGTLGNAKLEYSTDGGTTYPNTIIASTSSTGPYSWSVPSTTGTQYRVKITLLSDTTVYATSNTNFSVRGSFTLTSPVGSESWVVGAVQNITWTKIGGMVNAKLEYSTDGGATWPAGGLITAAVSASALSYAWTIPDAIGSNLKVRISDASDATVNNVSPSAFTIKGSLTITAPVGGEVWVVGTSQNITWTKTGTIPNVKLEYSTDGGVTWPGGGLIVASTSGVSPYPWTIPDVIGTSLRVRISDLNAVPATPSVSGANFTIKGSLTITAPNGSEQWPINSAQNITWTKTGTLTGNLKLEYSTDGGVTYLVGNLISNTVAASGTSYAWTVPDNPTTQARVRITYLNDTTVVTQSAANFSIKGSLTVTAPVGGEVWIVGQSRNITWTKGGAIANVKLDYSTDGGATYPNSITASTPAANLSYTWTVPDSISTTVRVRITDVNDSTVNGASAANFTIKGSLTLTAPVGGETWIVGAAQNITWTKTGTISNVKLEYSTDAGVTYPNTVVASTPGGNLSYAWTVPDAIGTALRVKITNLADTTVNSSSAANFTIKGSLAITSPNGAEVWVVNESRSLTWTKQGSIANVKLEYSKNGFVDELQTFVITASTPAAPLSYTWTVADAIGTTTKVRVSDASDSTVKSLSAANFTIKGMLTVTAPNGGEVWTVLSSRNITWTKQGSIVNVQIQYSTDGGSTFPNTITTSTDATLGTYAWTIPDAIGATVKVRVTNTADTTVFDDSNANFKIAGILAVTSPTGGEKWIVGAAQNITWTRTGSIANVKLEYSTDSGVTYPNVIIATTPATALTYSWTIPNTPSATARVKISDVTDSTVLGTSAADFKIRAGITVTVPNGGEVWTVNSPQTITWTTVGTAATVKLEYSTDGGNTYPNLIIASTTNTGSYSWTVADAISTSARLKVTNTADVDSFGASTANFKIRGALTLTAPNGGQQWGINTTQNVTWTRTGSIVNVKLEYSTDGGTTYPNVITASTAASTGTYAWLIPDNPSATARVRVSDASDATVSAQSSANFSIKGTLTLTSPNGGEVWVVGTAHNITWTKFGAIANVKLEYSTDGGVTWPAGNLIIASTAASTLSYSWTIPDAIGSQLRVRISDAGDATVNAQSATNFSIKGSITLTSPVGAEVWIVGAAQNITWTKAGSFASVKLEYSTNGFLDETQTVVVTSSTPNNLTFAWTVPDAIGTTVKVRASDASNSTVVSVSGANFTIKGSLTMTSPNGGEIWRVGESRNITWAKTGSIVNVKLEYSTDGGSTYSNVITASTSAATGTYAWTVADAIGTNRRVRITNTADATVLAASAANFEIKGQVTVTSPVGGEIWVVGTSHNITWTKQGTFSFVKLEYSTDGGTTYSTVITASVDATTGTPYAWTVPDAIGSTLRVRATNTADAAVFATSGSNFKITGSLTLTAPNGGESWTVGSSQNVTWTKVGSIANVKLEYSTDGGTTYPNVIVASTAAGTGAYAWTIPDSIGTNRRVRVSDASDATVLSTSAANFTIKGGFSSIVPAGGEVWTVNSAQTITWVTAGTVANVKLEYSTDGGSTYPNLIVASTANTGTYSWTVPDAITTLARVRVSDVNNANALGTSAANFKIRGALAITAPNGGQNWVVGTASNITWTRTGSIANVKLEYSTDGGVTYPAGNLIIASTPASALSYSWTIPDAIGTQLRVRISDITDSTVNAQSAANFSIIGTLTVTAPVGGEVWVVGTAQNITWTKVGSIANVKLEYSTDGGVTYPAGNLIIASTPASALSYSWTIPDAIGTQLRVRDSDASNLTVNAQSAANFTVKGSISLTAPNGGQVWIVGATQNITWTKNGSFPNVKLEYSKNGFVDETQTVLITASTANTGTFAWTVPDAIGSTLKVRASDASNATVVSVSTANFEIKGSLTVVSPNGGEVWLVGETRNITWIKTGSIANVKIEYSTNSGASYPNVITLSTSASTGSYAWIIPDAMGATLRVRITNTADAAVLAASAANFTVSGSVTVTSPNGGEVWVVGSSHNITWTKLGSFATVRLEYSTNAFVNELQTTIIVASVDATTGTPYAWTVPDAIGSSLRVRVTNTAGSSVTAMSGANFKITGSLTLTAPNGGESWTVGTSQNVTWTKVGSIANVKLEYSTDGGTTYPNVIIASTAAGTGAYAWTIPDSIGTNRRVRISDASDATVLSTSAANFTIKGGFTLTSPNGGEVWTVGGAQTIAWTTAGTVATIKLEYSTDGGSTYPNLIVASTANTGTSSWTVPDAITTLARVRVSDVNNANALGTSAANFKIRGALTITAPNGGESWAIATTQNITWSRTGSITNVKLEYSTNGFTNELQTAVITASTPASTGTYAWLIPNAPSTTVKVRTSDASDATVSVISGTNFSIIGRVTITAPNGGEVWIVGQNNNVTWTLGGSIANVKIQYSTDGGTTWPDPGKVITASTAASTLSYTWTIPDDVSATVKVRTSDASNPSVFSTSATNFAIKGSLTVTAPNGSEVWVVGTSQNITWTKTGTIAAVKLEYSTDGGTTYPNLIIASVNATTGTPYAWTIPDAIGNTVRVRVTHTADSAVFGTSAANFSIKGSLAISSPNGGEVWAVGSTQPITWSKVGSIANVKLEYSTDGGVTYPNVIANPVAAGLGSYSWVIPDAITTTARVKVTNTADTAVFANSATNFKIAGSVTITAPIGGEAWAVASSKSITWTKTGSIANVKLEYSTDGGATYPNLIAAAVSASTGTPYTWVVPDNPTATAKVKVTNTADSTVFGASPANFKIQGSFVLTAPNGGEVWIVGQSQSITWTKIGSIANAKLEYSTDGGVTYPNLVVASTAAANLSYAWIIPDAIGTTVRVRVSDAGDPTVLSTSAANFTIKGSLVLTAPNGGEAWVVGATQNITWTRNGSIASVKLEYSTDGGATFPSVIVASTPGGNLSYAWVVPDAIGSTLKVRISDVAGVSLGATSAGNFAIKGSLTITTPIGGEVWIVGTTHNVTWTRNGSIANVKLEYSTNGFTDELQTVVMIASTPASTGTYSWVVPDAISNTVKVRATDATDATVFAKSASNFTIKGALTITAPNGGEKWVVGTTQTISWTRAGSIANVNLKYTTDGTIFTDIIASTPNTGSYAWVIPNTTTTTALVRIYNVSDITVTSTSAAYFKIQAGFTMTVPNGGETWLVGSSQNITWTTQGTVAFAKLDYSTDGGVTFPNIIVSSTSNTGTYAWTVPNAVSGAVQVRVSDASDATAFKTSNANFRIRAFFTLSAPNGSEQWRVGQTQNIVWAAVGTIPNTKLQYSRDGFVADIQTINAAAPSTGTYAWTIPDAISNTVKIRVSDPNDVGALKDSAANFRITGDFTVTAPNGGEQWIVGNTYNITWTKTGSVTNAKIEYSTDGGGTYSTIVGLTPNNGTYAWLIPNAITALARVRISDPNDATANGISAANFKIKANFTLTSPVGGEVWTVGESRSVTWTNTGTVPNVKLDYSTDGGVTYPNAITASTSNTLSYTWTVPDSISTTVRVRVMSTTDVDAFAASAANLKIRGAFTLTAPNGGEGWKIAQTFNITWTRAGSIANAKLEYSTDGGVSFPNLIIASTPAATLSYAWVIPNTPSTTARVRISDVTDSTVFAASVTNFRIQGNFTLTSPIGGEVWTVNDVRSITWTWGGTIPNVKLTYSMDGGATYPNVIAASAPNGAGSSGSFSYSWTVPNSISTTVRVKIEDPNDATVFAASAADFKIQGKLVLVAPNGAERWVVNESRTILWTTTGTVPNVKLEYSTDAGVTWPAGNLIVASTPNTGSYAWTIPNNVTTTARVRVSNVADLTVFGLSAANFKIDLYQITFDIRDLLSNNSINQLTVSATTTIGSPTYNWVASGLAAPIVKGLQAGSWSVTFTQTAYGDLTLNFVVDQDKTLTGFMETKVVHIYDSHTEVAYDPSTDILTLSTTLLRDGITVTGATSCVVNIYDGGTSIKTFTKNAAPDTAQGFYTNTWAAPTGLVAGKVYNMVTTITIATGGVFNSPRTFQVTGEKKLQAVQDTINTKLDTPLSQVKTDILTPMQTKLDAQKASIDTSLTNQTNTLNTKLDAQTTTIQTKMDTQTGIIQTKMDQGVNAMTTAATNFTNTVSSSIVSLQSAVNSSLSSADTLKGAAQQGLDAAGTLKNVALTQSAKLLVPKEAVTGLPLVIKWRGPADVTGMNPKVTIENSEGKTLVKDASMTPVSGTTNLFYYTIDTVKALDYSPGRNIAVIVKEDAAIHSLNIEPILVRRPEGRLLLRTTAKAGEKVSVQLVGADNWSPLITLTSAGETIVPPAVMKKVGTKDKITTFEYTVPETVSQLVPVGTAVTVVVTEPTTGFFDQGTFNYTATSLDDLAGQIASQSGGVQAAKETLNAIQDVKGSLATGGDIGKGLEEIKVRVERIPRAVAEEGASVQMRRAIQSVAERVNSLAGAEGLDMSQLVMKGVVEGVEKAPTLKEIRKKTDLVQGATEVMQKVVEQKLGGTDEPIVHAVFE